MGAAILEGQEHAQHESVRVYLSQSVLPAITEALTAMEKERCPNPVPRRTRLRHLLDMHMCCAVPNDQSFGLRTSSRSFAIRRHKAETGCCVDAYVYDAHQAAVAVLSTCATLVTAVLHRTTVHRPHTAAGEWCGA